MTQLVRFVVVIIALLIWSTVGVAVWVAIVTREILLFSLSTLISLISGKASSRNSTDLDTAAALLPKGYATIVTGLFKQEGTHGKSSDNLGLAEFTVELVIACIFYLTIAWASDFWFATDLSPIRRIRGFVTSKYPEFASFNFLQSAVVSFIVFIVIPFSVISLYQIATAQEGNRYDPPMISSKFWGALAIACVAFGISFGLVYWAFRSV